MSVGTLRRHYQVRNIKPPKEAEPQIEFDWSSRVDEEEPVVYEEPKPEPQKRGPGRPPKKG